MNDAASIASSGLGSATGSSPGGAAAGDAPTLAARIRARWHVWALWVVVALVAFAFFLQWTFPYDRVRDRVIDALSEKYNVTIGSVKRGILPGNVSFHKVALEARATKAGEVPRVIFIDSIDLGVGVFAAAMGNVALSFDVDLAGGMIDGELHMSKSEVAITATGRGVPMANVPGLEDAVGLPVGGKLNLDVDLTLPYTTKGKRAVDVPKIGGKISLSCAVGCTVGDGVARVKPGAGTSSRNAAFAADGIVVPQLSIGTFAMELVFAKGHAKIAKFDLVSPDGDADVVLDVALSQVFGDSEVEGCIKFKLSQELKAREEKFGNIQAFIGTPIDKDGYNNIELFRSLRRMGRRPAAACSERGATAVDAEDAGSSHSRPSPPSVTPTLAPTGVSPSPTGTPSTGVGNPSPDASMPAEVPVISTSPYGGDAEIKARAESGVMTSEEAEAARKRAMDLNGDDSKDEIRIEPPPPPPQAPPLRDGDGPTESLP